MSAYVVFIRETVTDPQALDRYRELTPVARDAHPLGALANGTRWHSLTPR